MKITTEDLGNRQVLLNIEVDQEHVENALRGAARRIARQYNIPGFRRGRAPYHVILQRVGREALLQESLEDLGQEAIKEALEREELEPYAAGELHDVQMDPLTFKIRVPLRPKVDLGDYRALRIEPLTVTVQEEQVQAELERLRQENAILEPINGRPAQMGDAVLLELEVELDGDSILKRDDYRLVLDPDFESLEAGFCDHIVGLEIGAEKQFALALSDNWGADRTGKLATFSVKLNDVKNRILPDLDDDLARTVGDFDTLEDLRQNIRQQLVEHQQRDADSEYAERVIEALVSSATIEYPPELIEDQMDDMVEDLEKRLETQGADLENLLKLSGRTKEDYRESLRPQAETIIRRGLALGKLAQLEGLTVQEVEVDQHITLLSAGWGERTAEVREALSDPDSLRSIASRLLTDKAVQRLIGIAKGEAPELEEDPHGGPMTEDKELTPEDE